MALGSLSTSVIFVAVTTPFEVLLGLAMALVLNESFRGRGWLRAIVLIPWAVPTVVSSQMWRFIFNDRYGLFNYLLFGDATQLYWAPLAEPGLALIVDHGGGHLEDQRVCRADHSRRTAEDPR